MMKNRSRGTRKVKGAALLLACLLSACLIATAIGAIGHATVTEPTQADKDAVSFAYSAQGSQPAGDSALPPLDGDYAYVMATVTAKDADADSITVSVLPWQTDSPFRKCALADGETGPVLCSELPFFPGGINIGTVVVISCPAADADSFPLTAYSIEKRSWFEDRVARWEGA